MSGALPAAARRTLPAPRLPDQESASSEQERLAQENATLTLRVLEYETRQDETANLLEEVSRLRAEVAEYRRREARARTVLATPPLPPRPNPPPLPARPDDFTSERRESSSRDRAAFDAPLYAPGATPTGMATMASSPEGGLDFGTVSRLTPSELDGLPYGLICLDAQGRVVHYNDMEARLARLPREAVMGRNFFQEVAPCTRVREFEGQFHELVRDPGRIRVRSFDFIFRFRHGEQHVTIVLTPARQRGLYNMALLRRRVGPAPLVPNE